MNEVKTEIFRLRSVVRDLEIEVQELRKQLKNTTVKAKTIQLTGNIREVIE